MSECPHCYCQDKDVSGKPHVVCCMCSVRKLGVGTSRLPYLGPSVWTDYPKSWMPRSGPFQEDKKA